MAFPGQRSGVTAPIVSMVFIFLSGVIPSAELVDYRIQMLPGKKLFWKTGL